MKVAVIGGGVFGAMTAIRLAEMGETVSLFERLPTLIGGTSYSANRLHQGFHYPRDEETARQCVLGFSQFKREFGGAILRGLNNAYFIASEGSLTSPTEFLAFCRRIGLRFQEIELDGFQPAVTSVALGVLTEEVMFDADILRRLMTDRLRGLHVDTRVASEVIHIERHGDGFEVSTTDGDKRSFAAVVNCCYADVNRLTARLGHPVETYQQEYVAVPAIELDLPHPASLTILDGPFMSLLPLGKRGHYLLYHVDHAVIARDNAPLFDPAWLDPDTSPFVSVNQSTWFRKYLDCCCEFIPALRDCRLMGIAQGPRVVLAHCDDTDARPAFVTQHEPGYVSVFSGKVGQCVWAAEAVVDELACLRA